MIIREEQKPYVVAVTTHEMTEASSHTMLTTSLMLLSIHYLMLNSLLMLYHSVSSMKHLMLDCLFMNLNSISIFLTLIFFRKIIK